jgi:hypothetical protein
VTAWPWAFEVIAKPTNATAKVSLFIKLPFYRAPRTGRDTFCFWTAGPVLAAIGREQNSGVNKKVTKRSFFLTNETCNFRVSAF